MPYRCLYSPIKIGAMEVPNRFVFPRWETTFRPTLMGVGLTSRSAYYEAQSGWGLQV